MKNWNRIAGVALALGVCAGVAVPGTAAAAGLPDLVAGTLYFKSIDVAESTTLNVMVRNNGDAKSPATDVLINLGPGLALLHRVEANGWHCSSPIRSNDDGSTSTTCTSSAGIEPGAYQTIPLAVRGEPRQPASAFYLKLGVDFGDRITESDEDNNINISNY